MSRATPGRHPSLGWRLAAPVTLGAEYISDTIVRSLVVASRLNLTPEHFSRILRDLSDRGLIRVRGREYTVLDPDGLRGYKG